MSLSYSSGNIIKVDTLVVKGKKTLATNVSQKKVELSPGVEELLNKREDEIQQKVIDTEKRCEEIIQSAREKADSIVENSKNEVENIEKKAYEEGYSQGLKNGYEDGYKEAYEDNIEKAKQESTKIIESSSKMLMESKKQLVDYMNENTSKIIALSINIAEKILREKFEETSALDSLVKSTIEEYELKENFVVRVNTIYKDSLDNQIDTMKKEYKINSEVFILADDTIEYGNAIIDTTNGKLIVGIDSILEKIKEEIL